MKKMILMVCSILLICSACTQKEVYMFTSFHEPADAGLRLLYSYDGYHWNDLDTFFLRPTVGQQKVMRDPSIAQGPDGTYHLVWTSSWRGDLGFGYASSKDLIHWSESRFLPVMAYDTTTVNVWAPEICYDQQSEQFIIVWASCIPYKFERGIEDERGNYRLYCTTTKDFQTFSETKLYYDPGFSVIDAVIVCRGQDDYVLVMKDNTRPERDIKVAFGPSAMGPFGPASKSFTNLFTEGPSVLNVGEDYLIYFDAYRKGTYDAVRTKDFVHFESINDEISVPKGHKHGSIFSITEKELKKLLKYSKKTATQESIASSVSDKAQAQVNPQLDPQKELVHYTGTVMSNVDYHHGQLQPAIGVHNQQIFRANRSIERSMDGYGWTYSHAPMMAYWNKTYYVEYLSDSISEHVPPCHTLLITSKDGHKWSKPEVIFPKYKIPDGFKKSENSPAAKDAIAVMHQRVGFYVSSSNKLLAIAFYGISLFPKDDPNDGNGIGRVVREIKADGSYGPIYFLHYNHAFNESNTSYPFYKKSSDKKFVAACDEILSNPLYTMQMVEESDRNDPIIPLHAMYKAFSYYHLPNGDVVGLWKHALTSISKDGGKTWYAPVSRAYGFVNSNAKIWGQKTSDNKYATVYNPSEYRWPLAVSTSKDGLEYTDLMLIHGEISPLRYGGNYKNRGPQYVRGIQEGNGITPDGKMWLTYSMNKEDIWVSSVPVPIVCKAAAHTADRFNEMPNGKELDEWNTYDLIWASTRIERDEDQQKCLVLRDKDPFDQAKAEKIFPSSSLFTIETEIMPLQNNRGCLQMEIQNAKGQPSIRISFDPDGKIYSKAGARYNSLGNYTPGKKYSIRLNIDCARRYYTIQLNDAREVGRIFYAPAAALERVVFRTGDQRRDPTPETPADCYTDLENADAIDAEAAFRIYYLKTAKAQ